jgi:hypothetical protein
MNELVNGVTPVDSTQRQRFEESYDAMVHAIEAVRCLLTEHLLKTTLPTVLFTNAVLWEWIPDPMNQKVSPTDPCRVGFYTVERRYWESFLACLESRISFWITELELDQAELWDTRVRRSMPPASDPLKENPETLLLQYRQLHGQDNWNFLAETASSLSPSIDSGTFLAAIYRILKGVNARRKTLEWLAAAMSTPGRHIDWKDLRWPKTPCERAPSKSANNK